jgi:soluble lytic murein transglycosylase-like protein
MIDPGLLDAVIQVESHWDANAYNKKSKATGLGQITPPALNDFNTLNKEKYTMEHMKDPQKNMRVTNWYLSERIPQMLKHYNIPVTLQNILASYNFGIGNVKKGKAFPEETQNYIKSITSLLNGKN